MKKTVWVLKANEVVFYMVYMEEYFFIISSYYEPSDRSQWREEANEWRRFRNWIK